MTKPKPPTLQDIEAAGNCVWLYCRDCCHEVEEFASVLGLPMQLSCPEVRARAVKVRCSPGASVAWKWSVAKRQRPSALERRASRSSGLSLGFVCTIC